MKFAFLTYSACQVFDKTSKTTNFPIEKLFATGDLSIVFFMKKIQPIVFGER